MGVPILPLSVGVCVRVCVWVCGLFPFSPFPSLSRAAWTVSLRAPPVSRTCVSVRCRLRVCPRRRRRRGKRGGGGGGGRSSCCLYIYIYGLFAYTFIKSLRITQLLTEKKEKNELTMKRCARVLEAAAACITADRGDGGKAGGGGGGDGTVTAMWLRIIQGHTCAERGQANRL